MFFWEEEEEEGVVADYKGIWKNSSLSPTRRLLLLILFGIIHLNVLPNKQLFVSMPYSVDQWTINSIPACFLQISQPRKQLPFL